MVKSQITLIAENTDTEVELYTSLASGSGLQDSHLGLPFVVRHGYGLPGR